MKPRTLDELKSLLASNPLLDWWEALVEARRARDEARAQADELATQAALMDFRSELAQKAAIETLYRSGELEDLAARRMAESQELENASFKAIADYEEQRYLVSEKWYAIGGAERRLEALREKAGATPRAGEVAHAEKALAELTEVYRREDARKDQLWGTVEAIWVKSMELSLLTAETQAQARQVKTQAEALFREAEERKQRAKSLRAEAEASGKRRVERDAQVRDLFREAEQKFSCIGGDDFLYFRERAGDHRLAWAVALVDSANGYNVEVKALGVYTVDRTRGVNFLEPAVETHGSEAEGDRRFEDYFLHGRKKPGSAAAAQGGENA